MIKPHNTITRSDLLDAISLSVPDLTRVEARTLFEMALEEIAAAALRGEGVNIRAFGHFSVRSKNQRLGRNPRTGVAATITPRRVMTFKPSPALIRQLNSK